MKAHGSLPLLIIHLPFMNGLAGTAAPQWLDSTLDSIRLYTTSDTSVVYPGLGY